MKKTIRLILLLGVLTALLCVSVLADGEPTSDGIYGVSSETGVTITPKDVSKTTETIGGKSVDFFADAEKLTVSYTGAASGKYYLLLVTNKETTAPTASDIVYIDQITAGSGGVTFTAYPSALSKGTYYVYLASNAGEGYGSSGLTKVGSFESYVYTPPYTLGDVNSDGNITANDALLSLQIAVDYPTVTIRNQAVAVTATMRLAADVNKKDGVTANDALLILKKAVGENVF